MKSINTLLFFSLILLGCGQHNSPQTELNIKKSSIVNGEEVDPVKVETKYIVSLDDSCAGSIIAPKWILTASHCEQAFRNITAGGIDKRARKRISLKVKKSYFHPLRRSTSWGERYDFALIELKTPIDFKTTGLKSIKIADAEFENAGGMNEGTNAMVLGWGHTYEGGSGTDILRKIDIQILNFEKANGSDSYKGKLDESMFVAGDGEGKKDSCNGDSGGPLTIVHPMTGELTLAGVVSWGDKCATKNFPGVYGKVSHVHEWIMKTISE